MDEAQAAEELARAAVAPPPGGRPLFRLWHFPPGEPWRTWTLFLVPGGGLLREVARNGEAPVAVREVILSDDGIRSLRAQAAHLSLPEGDVSSRLAVTEYGIEGFAKGAPLIRWSSPVPPALGAVAAWHSNLRAAFLAVLDVDRPRR